MADVINSVDYKCESYRAQVADWQVVNDVYQGTRHMREQGGLYLPREPAETYKAYSIRLNRTVLFNILRQTIKGLAGMVFKRDPSNSNDVPVKIKADFDDIDLRGTHYDVFAKYVFEAALKDGHAYILVDHPKGDPSAIVSKSEAESRRLRPYWLMYTKDDVVNWRHTTVNNVPVLTQVTLRETVVEPTGRYGENIITQYRVLRPGSWEVYRSNNVTGTYSIYDSGPTSLRYIPLVPVYTERTGLFTSNPPFLDLTYLNIRHFQIYSDYAHILHVANVPITWFIGRDKTKTWQEIGPNSGIDLDSGGSMGFAEHGGQAIGGARTEIHDLEERMIFMGLQPIAKRSGATTATESVINRTTQSSVLSGYARNLKDSLEFAQMIHADYYGLPSGGSSSVLKDFDKLSLDPQVLNFFLGLITADPPLLDIETLWLILEQADQLPDEFEESVAIANIEKMTKRKLDYMTKLTEATGKGDVPTSDPEGKQMPSPPNPRTGPEQFGQGLGV